MKILELLSKVDQNLQLIEIQDKFELTPSRVELYLEELSDDNYIDTVGNIIDFIPTSYRLEQKGRKLLFDLKKI